MSFEFEWTREATEMYNQLRAAAERAAASRARKKKSKSSKQEGLFKQVRACLEKLRADPRHPSLNTHEYDLLHHPYNPKEKVFEAYVQNKTPAAWRVFWCYGPKPGWITILTITPHP